MARVKKEMFRPWLNAKTVDDVQCVMEIHIRSSLSLTEGPRGNRYLSTNVISDSKIYGLLENILGYYLDYKETVETITKKGEVKTSTVSDKGVLIDDIKSIYGKDSFKRDFKFDTYLLPVVSIVHKDDIVVKDIIDDYTYRNYNREDKGHFGGLKSVDFDIIHYNREEILTSMPFDKVPGWYSAQSKVERIVPENPIIKIKLELPPSLLTELEEKLKKRTAYFLGDSEGLIDVYIKN
jgi:hypothetical protein